MYFCLLSLFCKEFAYTRINESYILDEPHWKESWPYSSKQISFLVLKEERVDIPGMSTKNFMYAYQCIKSGVGEAFEG